MTVGSQIKESHSFSVTVFESLQNIEEKLLTVPPSSYEIKIGEIKELNLGVFQGNGLDRVFLNYEIISASDESLKDKFKVQCSISRSKNISLTIDLREMDP